MEHHKERSAIDSLKPKTAFKAGLASGIGIVLIIGFFVLLGVVLKGDGNDTSNNNNDNANNVANNNANNNAQVATLKIEKGDWIRGDEDADVTVIEFSDADCPFCSRFHTTMQQVMDEYGNKVNWVYRHFPLPSLHPEATKKAEAVECVGELGGNDKVWEFLDELYEQGPTLAQLADTVAKLGLDSAKFQSCLDSGKYTSRVNSQAAQAQAAGGQGTPFSMIVADGKQIPIPGALPYDSIKASLDSVVN